MFTFIFSRTIFFYNSPSLTLLSVTSGGNAWTALSVIHRDVACRRYGACGVTQCQQNAHKQQDFVFEIHVRDSLSSAALAAYRSLKCCFMAVNAEKILSLSVQGLSPFFSQLVIRQHG